MVFIDLEKAFDRVPRQLIWQAMQAHNIPEYYVHIVKDMYRNAKTRVRCPAGTSDEFEVGVGVHQGSALSPLLFNLVMNYLTAKLQQTPPWNLLYADDIVLISERANDLQIVLENWRAALETAGLRISKAKTVYLHCNFSGVNSLNTIHLQDTPLKKVDTFKYLGSVITSDGTIDADIAHRINTGWMKWKELSGVMCDNRMPVHIKGKVYKAAIRPAIMYGAECWPLRKQQEDKLHTTEMRMLRWAGGVTLLDHVRNAFIRGSFRVKPIPEKLQESRLRWYGHVMRRPRDHMTQKVMNINPPPKRRGRPRQTWMATINRDLKKAEIPAETTRDRKSWRRVTRRADPK